MLTKYTAVSDFESTHRVDLCKPPDVDIISQYDFTGLGDPVVFDQRVDRSKSTDGASLANLDTLRIVAPIGRHDF
jgi:hypothetical protein